MFILLLLCIAHVVNSGISVQTESTTNQNVPNTSQAYQYENIVVPVTGNKYDTQTNNKDSVNNGKGDVKISFSENATNLIKELKESIEKLIAYLATSKSSPKLEDPMPNRRTFQSSILDIIPKFLRNKRSVENITDVETGNNSIHILTNLEANVTEANINVTEAVTENADTTLQPENKNENDTDEWLVNNSDNTSKENINSTKVVNSRRTFNSDMEIAKVIRNRLLSYVHEHINDTMFKIGSLKNIKNSFGTDNAFNIGYIMANIDLIEVNLKKLGDSIDKSHNEWAEAHILDVFDKIKYTNQVVTSLITALKAIVNTIPIQMVNENTY